MIMQTTNSFSLQRFFMLFRQSFRINKKIIGITVAGFFGIVFILLFLFQSKSDFTHWDNNDYMGTFIFLFFILGIVYSSLSFPDFRSKEKSIAYLMLPASASEKYIFEFVTRIVAFVLLMPLLFWLTANIEGAVIHHWVPGLEDYKFSFGKALDKFYSVGGKTVWDTLSIILGCLFIFLAAFTGASHFSKSPLMKTLFTFSLLCGGSFLYVYLLSKGLNIDQYNLPDDRILFISNGHEEAKLFTLAASVINISLLAISWFRLKEKEA